MKNLSGRCLHPWFIRRWSIPDKKYEVYCLKVPESGPVVQYKPISDYKMDGLQPRIDLRPGTEIPVYPEDEVDANPHFNEYPPYEEFVEGPEWTPSGIPPKIHSPEYSGNTSDTSIDTQADLYHSGSIGHRRPGTRWSSRLHISWARYPQGGTHSPSGFNPAVCHTGGTGDTKADPGTQPPVSPRRTAEVCQPDNAPDPFRGGMGLPQPVLPKSFGHTPD